ncbi:prepilin-type N-terminal cleavage/methylation domain-containing protein [Marinospirillum celere]|uniref:Prepilin-type N-terminal cleavage/methylation domain-containing protein n=1 Tax=Marinospirillum celere TaxID=1122252 RepID=A0A1I1I3U7_9GAMM|nr:prepilin-type N-terminal cleavage/methylation domain-containing protein [Marinospirillum celere]SFC27890.1 prepilin-type N-terminal cleavage/methylation domain-containing protein [Marinospirillum celere]
MQPGNRGFSLLELLIVAALGSLLLLATSEVFARLVFYQTDLSAWLRLEEKAALAETALKTDLKAAHQLVALKSAERTYPDFSEQSFEITESLVRTGSFQSARSSDWLLINRSSEDPNPDFSLWHLDQKTYGRGLAHKASRPTEPNRLSSSQTLIAGVELLRFRFYSDQQKAWLSSQQAQNSEENFSGIQFAILLASEQAQLHRKQPALELWGEQLRPPQDGRLRLLITGSLPLRSEQP